MREDPLDELQVGKVVLDVEDLLVPATPGGGGVPPGASPDPIPALSAIGSSIRNVLPSPGTLSAPIEPAIVSTRLFERARPDPVPSIPLRSAPSREKGVKRLLISSGAIPSPVSVTVIRKEPVEVVSPEIRTSPPTRLNLTAFESRFRNTCFRR
jgi:hypothetical protein